MASLLKQYDCMEFTKYFLFIGFITLVGMSACKKESTSDDSQNSDLPTSMEDLKVADDFNFESTLDIKMRIRVDNGNYKGEVVRVNVYDDFPTIASLITSQLMKVGDESELTFRIPSTLDFLYLEKVSANGAKELQRVSAAKYMAANFDRSTTVQLKGQPGSGLNCTTGCTTTYNNHNGNLTLSSGTICITGTYSGTITLNGSVVVRICGTADIDKIKYNNNSTATVYFLENSIVTLKDLDMNNSNTLLLNFSDSLKTTNNDLQVVGQFTNNGKMNVQKKLKIQNQNPGFINNGELYVKESLEIDNKFTNNNSLLTNAVFTVKNNATFINNCQVVALDDIDIEEDVLNYSFIKCYKKVNIKNNGTLTNYNGALVSTDDIDIDGTLDGTTSNGLSTVKVADNTNFKNNGEIKGYVELCDSSGINTNSGTLTSPAVFACANYIATSACNTEGFGTATVTDTDGDGVADALDDYPNDATRAYNSYYPNASTYSTIGFEDLWPSQGDFDFNDLVISYRIKQVQNASNNVVETYTTYLVRAIGATYDNGFGIQLDDVTPSEISSITGQSITKNFLSLNSNGTESGQNKAVIFVYDSPEPLINRVSGSMFNTIKTNGTGSFDTVSVHVTFSSPLASSKLTMGKINPFIIIDGQRGVELHLPDMAPTNKANTQLLGTQDDDSNPSTGRYYKTSNNLPFVIEVPTTFSYPAEKESISDAYTYFINWAVSGGVNYTNWYENISGYRNANKIY